jgi:hypothetical protein
MLKSRRRVAIALTAAASAAVTTLSLAAPAQAVTVPAWPTAGYVPVLTPTCQLGTVGNDVTHLFNAPFTDTTTPTIAKVLINSGTALVVAPGAPTSFKFRAQAVETCGGVGAVRSAVKHNGAYSFADMTPETTNAFSGTWSAASAVLPSGAGLYQFNIALVSRRYDTFNLGSDFELISSTPYAGTLQYTVGAFSSTKLYVLSKSTLAAATSAAKVKKGKTVKATAQLKYAGDSAYLANNGGKVVVQTKVGSGRWVSNATLTANASGVVSYTFVVNATTSVRFIHGRTISGRFTETVVSPIKVVTKI